MARVPPLGRRLAGLLRLVHPFPTVLDGLATTAIALLASGEIPTALRLGGAMLLLQASIGGLNDLIDASADAGRKPGKPIPAGMVTPRQAGIVVVVAAVAGTFMAGASTMAGASGIPTMTLAVAVLAVGYGYDRWAKGTAWSWVPFAIGIPLLPVFAWFGATGRLPAEFAILLPTAVAAGAALAISNARADLERDIAAGRGSVAVRLGANRAWWVSALLLAGVVVVALATLLMRSAAAIPLAIASVAAAGIVLGLVMAGGDAANPTRRERAWEVQAVGVALLAAGWLAGMGGLG